MARPTLSGACSTSTRFFDQNCCSPTTLCRWNIKCPCRDLPRPGNRPAVCSTSTRHGGAKGARLTAQPSVLSKKRGWGSRPEGPSQNDVACQCGPRHPREGASEGIQLLRGLMLAERISRRRLIAGSRSGRGIVLLWRGASARECCRDRGLRG